MQTTPMPGRMADDKARTTRALLILLAVAVIAAGWATHPAAGCLAVALVAAAALGLRPLVVIARDGLVDDGEDPDGGAEPTDA